MFVEGRIETTNFREVIVSQVTFCLDTPSALDQRIAFKTNCQVTRLFIVLLEHRPKLAHDASVGTFFLIGSFKPGL